MSEYKVKAWIEDNVIMCMSQKCTVECPRYNLCKTFNIKVVEENERY